MLTDAFTYAQQVISSASNHDYSAMFDSLMQCLALCIGISIILFVVHWLYYLVKPTLRQIRDMYNRVNAGQKVAMKVVSVPIIAALMTVVLILVALVI